MFFLGVVGLLQMVVLPGWLWLRVAKIQTQNPIEEGLYCFAASLMLNHWLVYLLESLGKNNQPAWLAIAAAEVILLLFLLRPWQRLRLQRIPTGSREKIPISFIQIALAGVALVTVLAFIPILIANWGTVFTANDDVASWDRWARDWFLNRRPAGSDLYPQLLPANWSLTYALMKTDEVKMFAKAIMPLFALGIPLTFISLAWNRRDRAYLAGSAIAGFVCLQYLGRNFLMTGYVDVPLAFFCFLTFYPLHRESAGPSHRARYLSLFFACATALTKQGGLLPLVAIAVYLYATRSRGRRRDNGESHAAKGLQISAWLSFAFVVLWYLPKIDGAFQGRSNLRIVLHDVHEGRNYLERIWYGCGLLIAAGGSLGEYLFILGAALTLASLLFPETRKLTLMIVLPAFLLWGTFFSYELRTGALLIPFAALVWCLTLREIGTYVGARLKLRTRLQGTVACEAAAVLLLGAGIFLYYFGVGTQLRSSYAWPLMIAAVVIAVVPAIGPPIVPALAAIRGVRISAPAFLTGLALAGGFAAQPGYPDNVLIGQQRNLQKTIGNPAVDARLYRLLHSGDLNRPVLTNYWYLGSLPELGSLNRGLACGDCSVSSLWATVAAPGDAGFLLVEDDFLPTSTSVMLAHCAGLGLVFAENTVRLFRIDRTRLQDGCQIDKEAIRPLIERLYPQGTQAGVVFNRQSNGSAAIAIGSRNVSTASVIVWAGTQLPTAYGGASALSAEVPSRLYSRPGRYPIEIVNKDSNLRSPAMYFEIR